MQTKRTLATLAATLLAATVATTVNVPAASAAASRVDCAGFFDGTGWQLGCDSLNGAKTVWYVDGVRIPEANGHGYYGFSCTYGSIHTVAVNPGTSYYGTWTGACEDTYASAA